MTDANAPMPPSSTPPAAPSAPLSRKTPPTVSAAPTLSDSPPAARPTRAAAAATPEAHAAPAADACVSPAPRALPDLTEPGSASSVTTYIPEVPPQTILQVHLRGAAMRRSEHVRFAGDLRGLRHSLAELYDLWPTTVTLRNRVAPKRWATLGSAEAIEAAAAVTDDEAPLSVDG